MMELSTSSSGNKQLEKLLRDYEEGRIPPGIKIDVEAIREKLNRSTWFEPHSLLVVPWTAFWEIRNTKSYDSPVNHTDVLNYSTVLGIPLEAWEVKTIIGFDRKYYASYEKYKPK